MDAGRHLNESETDPAEPRSARGSVVGKVLAGLALLAVGLCLGIVLGSVASETAGAMLRDVAISYLTAQGFPPRA